MAGRNRRFVEQSTWEFPIRGNFVDGTRAINKEEAELVGQQEGKDWLQRTSEVFEAAPDGYFMTASGIGMVTSTGYALEDTGILAPVSSSAYPSIGYALEGTGILAPAFWQV